MIEERISLLEDILGERQHELGHDYPWYKDHVYRMIHFCFAQREFSTEERERSRLPGCFFDLGTGTNNTIDHLPPSVAAADLKMVSIQDSCSHIKKLATGKSFLAS